MVSASTLKPTRRGILSLSAGVLASGLAGCQWVQEAVTDRTTPKIRWQRTLPSKPTDVAVGPRSVYVAISSSQSTDPILSIDRTDGESNWRTEVTGVTGLELASETLFVYDGRPDSETDFRTIDIETGRPRWDIEDLGFWPPTALTDETVYITTGDGDAKEENPRKSVLQARDLRGGNTRWSFEAAGSELPVAVTEGTLYLTTRSRGTEGTHDHPEGVYALDTADGSIQWSFDPPTSWGPARLGRKTFYVGSETVDGVVPRVYALDATDGSLRWQYEDVGTHDDGGFAWPTHVADDRVIVRTGDGVRALDVGTGTHDWTVPDDPLDLHHLHAGLIYVQRGRTAVAVTVEDGTEAWRFTAPETNDGVQFRLYDGVVTAISDRTVVGIDAETGKERWQHTADASLRQNPWTLSDGGAYLSSGETLYALDLP